MGYQPMVGEVKLTNFVFTPYRKLESGECSSCAGASVCQSDTMFEIEFGEDKSRNIYVDVNPSDKDGYEYKVVGKKLYIYSDINEELGICMPDRKWVQAGCRNLDFAVKDARGNAREKAFFNDNNFRWCIKRMLGVASAEPLSPPWHLFWNSAVGVFFKAYDDSLWSCVAN